MTNWRHKIAKILGNFMMDTLKPLIGINIGLTVFHISVDFQIVMWSSFISAMIGGGISLGRELVEYGAKRNGT